MRLPRLGGYDPKTADYSDISVKQMVYNKYTRFIDTYELIIIHTQYGINF